METLSKVEGACNVPLWLPAFAGQALRLGFLTSAAEAGADVLRMMEVSRHRRVETVQGYVWRASLFRGHAGAGFL